MKKDGISLFLLFEMVLIVAGFVIVIVAAIVTPLNKIVHKKEITITVTDKGIKNQEGFGKYLIYGKDEESKPVVVEITDSLFMLRFDSSDLYANIEIGKTYRCITRGYRIKIFSIYPNLYEIKEKD